MTKFGFKLARSLFLLGLIISWLFSGWSPLWHTFPLKIQEAHAADTGFQAFSANSAVTILAGDNNGFETSPASATADDTAFAISASTGTGANIDGCAAFNQAEDDAHDFYNFNLSVPAGATIDGIEATTIAKWSTNSGTNQLCLGLSGNGGTTWTSAIASSDIQTSDETSTYGGSSDTWGKSWTDTELNNTNFRLRIMIDPGGTINTTASLDLLQLKVYYTIPNSAPTLSISQPDGTGDTVNAGSPYNIMYSLSDSDDVVTASLYYDSDNTGLNGTAITGTCASAAEGTGATCSWDTTGVTPGSYYVYGITNDGVNSQVSDYSSGVVTINPAISISITTNGSIAIGTVATNTTRDTTATGINDVETVTVDSGPVDLDIKSSDFTNGGDTWSIANTNGVDQVKWEFSKDGTNWSIFSVSDTLYSLDTNVAQSQIRNMYFRLTMPTSTNNYTQFSSTITVVASAP